MAPLVLASRSPRRAELLRAAGIPFQVDGVDLDEAQRPGESPGAYVLRLALEKASRVAPRHPAAVVLGADTTVVVDGQLLAKPADASEAARMLQQLSGRTHQVLTGIALLRGAERRTEVVETEVRFAPLSAAEVAWYVASGEPSDKAGGYAIQGLASRFVENVNGSYSNVVGLPVAAVYRHLRAFGAAVGTD